MPIRLTVLALAPDDISEQIEAIARDPKFDDLFKNADGSELYRLGIGPDGIRRRAHLTSVQFEVADEAAFKEHGLPILLREIAGYKDELANIRVSLGGPKLFPIKAGTASYPPVLNEDALWADLDTNRDGLQEFNDGILNVLSRLPAEATVLKDANGRVKAINGVGHLKIRPHFTFGKILRATHDNHLKLVAALTKAILDISFNIPAFPVTIGIGNSFPSGEYYAHTAYGSYDAKKGWEENQITAPVPVMAGPAPGAAITHQHKHRRNPSTMHDLVAATEASGAQPPASEWTWTGAKPGKS